jgi:hypothetical protein
MPAWPAVVQHGLIKVPTVRNGTPIARDFQLLDRKTTKELADFKPKQQNDSGIQCLGNRPVLKQQAMPVPAVNA